MTAKTVEPPASTTSPAVSPPDLLTKDEIEALQLEVQKEIDKEAKAKAKEDLKKKMLLEARVARGLEEPIVPVLIDLPIYAMDIKLDNRTFLLNHTYDVRASVAAVLYEIMQKTWQHQAVIEGRSKGFFQKQRLTQLNGSTGAVTRAPFLAG
jgi:hypothetical protein